jgi:hypothetical protein
VRPIIDVDDIAFGATNSHEPNGLLDEYRVDLFELVERGIPEPRYVPGCYGFVRAGKRHLIPAPAGTGKSLAWLRIAVGIVKAGGTVAILDVENGADEYARRLECIQNACGQLAPDERQRLRYYEWPRISLKWAAEQWVAAVGDADLVIFDSSRLALSQVGLDENSSDHYAEFADALLLPLAKAGIATVMLDNTGHEQNRARGTKAKEDLNEVVFEMSARGTVDIATTGTLTFKLSRTRFSGLHRKLEMQIGGGVYEMPQPVEDSYDDQGNWRPTIYMTRVADALAGSTQPLTSNEIVESVGGKRTVILKAIACLGREGYIHSRSGPRGAQLHTLAQPYLGD